LHTVFYFDFDYLWLALAPNGADVAATLEMGDFDLLWVFDAGTRVSA
jgi:hypothetical protein